MGIVNRLKGAFQRTKSQAKREMKRGSQPGAQRRP